MKDERKYRRIQRDDRIRLEALLRAGHGVTEIARLLNFHHSSISREIRRGQYEHRNSDWTTEMRYSADLAEEKYQAQLRDKGPDIKLGKDYKLAEYLEQKIGEEKYSPAAALALIEKEGLKFSVTLSKGTVYNYIDKDIFFSLTNKELPVKGNKKKKNRTVKRQKRVSAGDSIDERPEEINTRTEFGHWEMDTVVGKQGVSKSSLLVLTERKTRWEIVEKLKHHTMEEVVKTLDKIERQWGAAFRKVFRSITMDNGTEFSDVQGIERARRGKKPRTKTYYCHAYSSWERGSNENQNRLIRRHAPKGTDFDKVSREAVRKIQDWINTYPREMFGFRTSEELFQEELKQLGIT